MPCAITLSSTVAVMTATAGPAAFPPRSSSASSANTTEARPRGPNQPTNAIVGHPSFAPIRASATGIILITVRLSTAYTTSCQVRCSNVGATATAPNASHTSSDTSAPVSSTNGTSGWPRRPAVLANARPPVNAAMKPLPCRATAEAYAHTAKPSTAAPAKPSAAQSRRLASLTSQPPTPPTTTPATSPRASSATAPPGPIMDSCAAVPAPATATSTNGVAIPSFSPLSRLIRRRILAGTARLSITPAPSAASVGARAAPISRASQMLMPPNRASASSVPRPIVSGRPIPSSRRQRPSSARRSRSPTRDASENSTSTSVTSARTFTASCEGAYPALPAGRASGPGRQ